MLWKAFPDWHEIIEDITAEGDKVSIKRIVDGKIKESWAVYDMLDFYKQLGVIEYKGFADEEVK